MPIFEIFLAAAPEVLGATEVAGALGAGALGAEALSIGALGAESIGAGLSAEGLASAAAANPELLAPNALADAAQAQALNNGIMSQGANPEFMDAINSYRPEITSMAGPESVQSAWATPDKLVTSDAGSSIYQNQFLDAAQSMTPPSPSFDPLGTTPSMTPEQLQASNMEVYPNTGPNPDAMPKSGLEAGWDKATKWASDHPFQAAGLGYMGASKLGLLDQKGIESQPGYNGPLSKYRLADNFQGRFANPADYQYTPRRFNSGGITQIPSYAKGREVDISQYTDMVDPKYKELPVYRGEIARDDDPDTRYLDPLSAAIARQSKLNSRSHVNTSAKFGQPTPMGSLNFKPVAAAHGGIMGHSSLGSYAAGGNPRLLRGPGDGMSDNIPATIDNHQPARLADGEFVIPADVVSHLGNGSTEAGAKKLHEMMTHVRKARTGNPKQGKEINANHFMPK